MVSQDNVTPLRSVLKAAESGSYRDLLVALRDRLATAVNDDRTQPRDLSPLTLRLKELQAEIAELDGREDDPDEPEDGDFDPETV
jgi:Fe-S-cluster formation regulator IscX/YfhJ